MSKNQPKSKLLRSTIPWRTVYKGWWKFKSYSERTIYQSTYALNGTKSRYFQDFNSAYSRDNIFPFSDMSLESYVSEFNKLPLKYVLVLFSFCRHKYTTIFFHLLVLIESTVMILCYMCWLIIHLSKNPHFHRKINSESYNLF